MKEAKKILQWQKEKARSEMIELVYLAKEYAISFHELYPRIRQCDLQKYYENFWNNWCPESEVEQELITRRTGLKCIEIIIQKRPPTQPKNCL